MSTAKTVEARRAQTANAREAAKQYAAERAIDDPTKLAKAARIVSLALERKRLTVDEKIAAAVAEAPPLPDDLAARLVELIRTAQPTPASEQEAA